MHFLLAFAVHFFIIFVNHTRRGKLPARHSDACLHHFYPLLTVIFIKRQNFVKQYAVKRFHVRRVLFFGIGVFYASADLPLVNAVLTAFRPPPSSMLKLRTPFIAAFMPDVPHASCGRRGVFSQTSQPRVSIAPMFIS